MKRRIAAMLIPGLISWHAQAVTRVEIGESKAPEAIQDVMLAAWTPPNDPDPRAILQEAADDARAGRYADALDKQVWIHEKSLHHASSFYGVRLSFALAQWVELGKAYPPALVSLRGFRERAEARARESATPFDAFHDVASIDRALGETAHTAELFVWLDAKRPEIAKQTFNVAQDALVASGNYALCGKYIDGPAETNRTLEMYSMTKRNPRADPALARYAHDAFANRAAMLVALLAVNGRTQEAQDAVREFTSVLKEEEFANKLHEAARGVVPAPWPASIRP